MFVIDTNILIYAADESYSEHKICRKLLMDLRTKSDACFLTWGIVYEFLRVVTHRKVLRKPWRLEEACKFIEILLATDNFDILVETEEHFNNLQVLSKSDKIEGNIIHDLHIANLMKEHSVKKIFTRDTHFHRFKFLEVIDPLS